MFDTIINHIHNNKIIYILIIIILYLIIKNINSLEHLTNTNCCPCTPDKQDSFSIINNRFAGATKRIGLKTTIDNKNFFLSMVPILNCNLKKDTTDCKKNILVLIEETELTNYKNQYDKLLSDSFNKCTLNNQINCANNTVEKFEEHLTANKPPTIPLRPAVKASNVPVKPVTLTKPAVKASNVPVRPDTPVAQTKSAVKTSYVPVTPTIKPNCDPSNKSCDRYKENNFINTFIIEKSRLAPKEFTLYGSANLDKTESDRFLVNALIVNDFNYACGDATLNTSNIFTSISFVPVSQIDNGGIISSIKQDEKYKIRIRRQTIINDKPSFDTNKKPITHFTYFGTCNDKSCNQYKRICLYDDILANGVLEFQFVNL